MVVLVLQTLDFIIHVFDIYTAVPNSTISLPINTISTATTTSTTTRTTNTITTISTEPSGSTTDDATSGSSLSPTSPSLSSSTLYSEVGDVQNIGGETSTDAGSNSLVVGEITGGVAVALALLLSFTCVALVLLRYKQHKKLRAITSRGTRDFENAIYGEGELTTNCNRAHCSKHDLSNN